MNPDVCNDYVIFLGSELEKRFKKVEIEEINTAIFIGKRKKYSQKKNNNMNDLDYATQTAKFNKKDLCQKVASHYIRMLNLVSAILSAVSPDKNVCSRRIKALYDSISSDIDSGFVKVCPSDDTDVSNMLYPENISELPGIKQLLNLYYFYLLQDTNPSNESEKKKIKIEFEKLQDSFNAVFTSSFVKPKHIPVELHETEKKINHALESVISVNQELGHPQTPESKLVSQKQSQTDQQLETVTNLLFDLKNQIDTLKSQNKGQTISQENMEALQAGILESMKQQIDGIKGDFSTQMQFLQDKVNSIVSEKAQQLESEVKEQMPSHQYDISFDSGSESGSESDIDVISSTDGSGDEDIDLGHTKKNLSQSQRMTPSLVSVLQNTPSSKTEITTMKDYLSSPNMMDIQSPASPASPASPNMMDIQSPSSPSASPNMMYTQEQSQSDLAASPNMMYTQVQPPSASPNMMYTQVQPQNPPPMMYTQEQGQGQGFAPIMPIPNQKGGTTPKKTPMQMGVDPGVNAGIVGLTDPALLPSKVNYNTVLKSSETPDTPGSPGSPEFNDSPELLDTPASPYSISSPQLSGTSDSDSDGISIQSFSDSESESSDDSSRSHSPIQTKSVRQDSYSPTSDVLIDSPLSLQTKSVRQDSNSPTSDFLIDSTLPVQTKSVNPTSDILIDSPLPVETKSTALYDASDIQPVVSSLLEPEEKEETTPIIDGVLTPEQHTNLLSSVEKFIEFVNKHSAQYKMDENFDLNLRPKTNEEIVEHFRCNTEPSTLTVKINDKEFYEFKKAYQRLKQHYLDSTKELLSILENKIIDKTQGNPFESEYKLRAVTNNQLNDIQIEVMRKLTLFYTRCTDYYQLAFTKLAESVKSIDEKDKNSLPS